MIIKVTLHISLLSDWGGTQVKQHLPVNRTQLNLGMCTPCIVAPKIKDDPHYINII